VARPRAACVPLRVVQASFCFGRNGHAQRCDAPAVLIDGRRGLAAGGRAVSALDETTVSWQTDRQEMMTSSPTLTFEDFAMIEVQGEETVIFLRRFGSGSPVLLLHGFQQTHLMWRTVAPLLAHAFTVICIDLRGYDRSGCPPSRSDHTPYSKRAMAKEMVVVMEKLGFPSFSVVGHDRGGRVAYRLALDHPQCVERLAADAWKRADKRLAIGYWPWSLLAQPEPFPERLLSAGADAIHDVGIRYPTLFRRLL
jgi:pimeloyl-ACP methyl ester carboxylesterase